MTRRAPRRRDPLPDLVEMSPLFKIEITVDPKTLTGTRRIVLADVDGDPLPPVSRSVNRRGEFK